MSIHQEVLTLKYLTYRTNVEIAVIRRDNTSRDLEVRP